ncbi:BREX system ATP-binding domain-containing protein [Actinokineospora enzanensis]|uniref:BREX system ATP-binding domain-containing protein n=1 Tax=Actinokineospora enzanensis TaxID=155975 RepID=UPI0003A16CFA|nr:BREX system ATP-binding domain-containing protein [Actinokineospora enzanensis]
MSGARRGGVARDARRAAVLVGRDRECAALRSAVRSLVAGGSRVVAVRGEPGAGRSALLGWAVAEAARAGAAVARACATPLETGLRFAVIDQLSGALPVDVDQYARRADFVRLCAGLVAAARRAPLVLAVDDAQWLDPQSEQILRMLVRRLHHVPVLMLLTTTRSRPALVDEVPPTVDGETMRPGPLSEDAVRELCLQLFAQAADPEFARHATAVTGGNPGVLVPALGQFARDGGRPCEDHAAEFGALAAGCRAAQVNAVLDSLSPTAAEVLRFLAISRGDLDRWLVTSLFGTGHGRADVVYRLRESGLVRGDGDRLRLVDAVTEHQVLARMTAAERRALHAEVAELAFRAGAPDDILGRILLGSRSTESPWAPRVLHRAASRALLVGNDRDAAALLGSALGEPVPSADRARLLVDLAAAEVRERPVASDRVLAHVVSGNGDGELIHRLRAADLLLARGACGAAERAIAGRLSALGGRLDDADTRTEHAALTALRALVSEIAQDLPEMSTGEFVHIEPAVATDEPVDPVAAGVAAWRLAARGTNPGRARLLANIALAPSVTRQPLAMPRLAACTALMLTDDVEVAERGVDAVLVDARRRGLRAVVATCLLRLGSLALRRGLLDTAASHLAAAVEELPPGSWDPRVMPFPLACQALVDLELGRVDVAEGRLATALPAAAESGLGWSHLLYARGALFLALGKPDPARRALLECGRRLVSGGWTNPVLLRWRQLAAEASGAVGDVGAARALLAEDRCRAEEWGTHSAVGAALLATGTVLGDLGECTGTELRRAEQTLRDAPARLLHARSLLALAKVELGHGARGGVGSGSGDAVRLLDRALRAARSMGAVTLAGRAEAMLRRATAASPARRGPVGTTARVGSVGFPGSTPRPTTGLSVAESRIVELAATGFTNPEIATALSVTRRTVELHLSSAYRKLGVSGRAELVRVLVGTDR